MFLTKWHHPGSPERALVRHTHALFQFVIVKINKLFGFFNDFIRPLLSSPFYPIPFIQSTPAFIQVSFASFFSSLSTTVGEQIQIFLLKDVHIRVGIIGKISLFEELESSRDCRRLKTRIPNRKERGSGFPAIPNPRCLEPKRS